MKKLFLLTALLFGVIAVTTTASAQFKQAANNEEVILSLKPAKPQFENTRPLRKFMKEFPGVTDDVWVKNSNGFFIGFTFKGIQNHVFLTKNGHCESRIQYYTENGLPSDIRHLVKSTYYDYSITLVKEVSCNNITAYLVTIEAAATWKVIRVVDGEMDVWEDHIKS